MTLRIRAAIGVLAIALVTLPALARADASWPISTKGTFLVMNKSDNTVTLVALASGEPLATLRTGREPHEGAASPDGRFVVISNTDYRKERGHTLTVVDVVERKVASTISLGEYANPHGIMFMPDGKRVIVTTEGRDAVVLVDVEKGEITQAIGTGGSACHMVVVSPDGKRAYATSIQSGTLVVLDLEKGELIKTILAGDGAEGLDIAPDGSEIWVGNRGEDTIAIIDTKTLEITGRIESKGFPIRLKFALGGEVALVSNYRASVVSVFDRASRKELARIPIKTDAVPIGILVAPDGRHAFIANTRASVITIIDIQKRKVVTTLQAGNTPDGMAWTRLGG
jgi:YVTN family beta-propeller protein